MVEIRLDDELLLYQNDFREALLETIDELVNDKRLTIIFNFPLDYRVDVKRHILD